MAIASLGYIGIAASDIAAWRAFGVDVLGLMPTEAPGGTLRFRLDEQAWRISVEPGPEDDIVYAGFEVAGPGEFEAVAERLSARNAPFERAGPDLLARRGVKGLLTCRDPEGLAIEIYYGPSERREAPFTSPLVSGFVTGAQGLGHIVLAAPDMDAARAFYSEVLGFQLSDIICMRPRPDLTLELEFYHCNPRHHSLALVPAPARKRLNHFMVQTNTLDDVGFALDRLERNGCALANTLGKHTNDHMVSFYVRTPSGFEVEYGWGAREVGDDWRVVRHDRTSVWGHHRVR